MKARSIVVVGVLFLGAAVCSAQSLGEVAKRVAAERAAKDKDGKVKPPPKTLTNKISARQLERHRLHRT